jgi:hypothetical protein
MPPTLLMAPPPKTEADDARVGASAPARAAVRELALELVAAAEFGHLIDVPDDDEGVASGASSQAREKSGDPGAIRTRDPRFGESPEGQ